MCVGLTEGCCEGISDGETVGLFDKVIGLVEGIFDGFSVGVSLVG